jgi:hypothetical protein
MRSSWSRRLVTRPLSFVLDQCPRHDAKSSGRTRTDERKTHKLSTRAPPSPACVGSSVSWCLPVGPAPGEMQDGASDAWPARRHRDARACRSVQGA